MNKTDKKTYLFRFFIYIFVLVYLIHANFMYSHYNKKKSFALLRYMQLEYFTIITTKYMNFKALFFK